MPNLNDPHWWRKRSEGWMSALGLVVHEAQTDAEALEAAMNEIARLRKEFQDAAKSMDAAGEQCADAERHANKWSNELTASEEQSKRLAQELVSARDVIEQSTLENERLRRELTAAVERVARLEEERRQLVGQVECLLERVVHFEQAIGVEPDAQIPREAFELRVRSVKAYRDIGWLDPSQAAKLRGALKETEAANADALQKNHELVAERDALKRDYVNACRFMVDVYEAATGRKDLGPVHGLTEDALAVRTERDALREALSRAYEALVWTGGSADFGPGGKAYGGWKVVVQPVLDDVHKALQSPVAPNGPPQPASPNA